MKEHGEQRSLNILKGPNRRKGNSMDTIYKTQVTNGLMTEISTPPVIATVLWCLLFIGIAIWRIRREEF